MGKISVLKKQFAVLKGNKKIVAVIFFGSWARREQKPLSDIDVCVIPSKGVTLDELMAAVPLVEASVSYFYNLPLHVRKSVLEEGKPLLVNDFAAFAEAKTRTVIEYLDFNPVRERMIKSMLAKGVF